MFTVKNGRGVHIDPEFLQKPIKEILNEELNKGPTATRRENDQKTQDGNTKVNVNPEPGAKPNNG